MSTFSDDVDIVDYTSSPSNMSFPASSDPASSVSPSKNDPEWSDNDYPPVLLTLDSFIPILRHLPGLYLDQNLCYNIRGSITAADWACLCDYARMVSKFIVTDITKKGSKARISPATFLRLARLQQPDTPLLQSLSDIVIVDADASIAYLELLLTPSLKSLKASCIPDAQQSAFFSFLTAIEQEAPLFQTLILGPGRFLPDCFQAIHKFNNLCHLELKHSDPEISFGLFGSIGSLPKLETFILDARHVSRIVSKKQPGADEPIVPLAFEDVNPLSSDGFSDSNLIGGSNEDGAGDILPSQPCHAPISTSGHFNQLRKLHIIAWLPLLEELIPRITSTELEDISVTFIRLSYDELKVNLTKEKAEQERRAEEAYEAKRKRRAEEWERGRKEEQERLWREEKERGDVENEEQDQIFSGSWAAGGFGYGPFCEHAMTQTTLSDEPQWLPIRSKTKNKKSPKERKMKAEQEPGKLLEEQERLASLSFGAHTASFAELLQTLYCRWTTSLKMVSVCQLGGSFQPLLKPPTLPGEIFRGLLLLPSIECLEVKGWMLDAVESVLNAAQSIPKLKSLLLPLDETNSGISLLTLRCVARTCPKLESFQCRIEPLSLIPKYDVPSTIALSHGLRLLSVGNSCPLSNAKRLYLVARHLYLLFPNLKTINTSEEYNAEQWIMVDELVKMCQTARIDDMNRPSTPITQ